MRRAWFAFALALVACGGASSNDGGTAPPPSIAGVYQLASINGAALPVELSGVANGPGGVSTATMADAGTLRVDAGGTYQRTLVEHVRTNSVDGLPFTVTTSGTYVASGSGYSFAAGSTTATVTSAQGTLTMTDHGTTYVFR